MCAKPGQCLEKAQIGFTETSNFVDVVSELSKLRMS